MNDKPHRSYKLLLHWFKSMTEVYLFQFSPQTVTEPWDFVLFLVHSSGFFIVDKFFIFLSRSRAVRRRSSYQLSVHRPAGPARCSPPSGTPSGHKSARTKVRCQHDGGEKGRTNSVKVSAVQKKKKKYSRSTSINSFSARLIKHS